MTGRFLTGNEYYRITVNLIPQPEEGGYMVICEELPELATQGDTIDEALFNTLDAFVATMELYEDLGKEVPDSIVHQTGDLDKTKIESTHRFWSDLEATLKKNAWSQSDIPDLFETKTPDKTDEQTPPYVFEAKVPFHANELSRSIAEA